MFSGSKEKDNSKDNGALFNINIKASRLLLCSDSGTDLPQLVSNIDYYLPYYYNNCHLKSDDVCTGSPDLMILLLANSLELAL